jgi:hypothetical protein
LKNILPLLIAFLSTQFALAQYCGNFAQPQPPYGNPSGPNQCTISGNLTSPGFSPASGSQAIMVNGMQSSTVIQFRNFDTARAAGTLVQIQQLRFDSIGNLPAGTCWASSDVNNTLDNQEEACIKISGFTCAPPGQYRLKILVTPYVGASYPGIPIGSIDAGTFGIYYYLRVTNYGDTAAHPIDTTGQSAGTGAFKPYGPAAVCVIPQLSVSLGTAQSVCSGTPVTLQPTITNGTAPYTYSWNTTGNSLSCNNCANPGATITQASTYRVTVTDANSATASASVSYTLSSNCGTCVSGPSACTPTGGPVGGGFEDASATPCATQGVPYSHAVQFTMYDVINFAGQQDVDSAEFVSITNLPCGLCWALNKASQRYSAYEDGCLTINGTTNDTAGQYKFAITLKIWINGQASPLSVPANVVDQIGIKLFQRVKTPSGPCAAVDTSAGAANLTACATTVFTANLGADQVSCANAPVSLSVSLNGGQGPYTYNWSSIGNTLICNSCANPTTTLTQNSTFSVTVTDGANHTATDNVSYTIGSGGVQINAGGPTTFCQGGSVTLNAGANFTAYSWSNSSSAAQIAVTQGGTYSVTVTNSSGCTFTDSEVVTVTTPSISNYQITASGPTSFCTGGSVTLNAGSGFTNYQWSNSSSSSTITVSQSGTYSVSVTGTDGCSYTDTQVVNTATGFSGQQICIVSLNPATSKNVVVWQKTNGAGIDSFRIYKEIAGQFQLIRQQAFADFSTYEDAQSNAANQSEKYAISTIDACGESAKSAAHQTMYLTYGLNGNNQMELNWTPYVGVTGSIVTVYRGSSPTNLSQLTQLGPGTLSYVDLTPPAPPVYYQVEITNPLGCVPSKTDGYSSSLSNILEVLSTDITTSGNENLMLYSFYDQNTGETVLRWAPATMRIKNVTVYDLSGRKVYANNSVQGPQVTLSREIATGAYVAEVSDGNKVVRKKIFVR